MWFMPAWQAGQVPSQSSGMTVTLSPTVQPLTPGPTWATVPDISCPMGHGSFTRPSMPPCEMVRSVPQMPV